MHHALTLMRTAGLSLLLTHCSGPHSPRKPRPELPFNAAGAPSSETPVDSASQLSSNGKSRGGVIEGNGGEYITNEHNPWFANGAPVFYCVMHDAEAFSVDVKQASVSIARAFRTWQDILVHTNRFQPPMLLARKNITGIALDFREVDCEQAHELEFQLGSKDSSLDEALKYGAKDIVALSLRRQYSDETGRANGRIWFSADLGTQRYKGPNSGPGFWKENQNFLNVVTHELGHIFGVRHTKAGFMAADFPAKLLEFGMKEAVSLDTFEFSPWFCGRIVKDEMGVADPTAIISQVYGIELEKVGRVCFETLFEKPVHLPFQESDVYQKLAFYLTDGSVQNFEISITEGTGDFIIISGQYLAQANDEAIHYIPWEITSFGGPFVDRGIQFAQGAISFINIDSSFPGLMSFSVGHEGKWHRFSIIKDSSEVKEMLNIFSREPEKNYSIVPLSVKALKAPDFQEDKVYEAVFNPVSQTLGFTPESVLYPLSSLVLKPLNDWWKSWNLYHCASQRQDECLVDLSSQADLDKLANSSKVEDQSYYFIGIEPVCIDGSFTMKVKGRFLWDGKVYYTSSKGAQITSDASLFDYASVRKSCEKLYNTPFNGSFGMDIAGGTFPLTLFLDTSCATIADPRLASESSSSLDVSFIALPMAGSPEVKMETFKIHRKDAVAMSPVTLFVDSHGEVINAKYEGIPAIPNILHNPNLHGVGGHDFSLFKMDSGFILDFRSLEALYFPEFQNSDHSGELFVGNESIPYTATKL